MRRSKLGSTSSDTSRAKRIITAVRMPNVRNSGNGDVPITRKPVIDVAAKALEGHALEDRVALESGSFFEEVPDGTRVTMHQDMDPFAGFFGKLADPLVTRMYSRDVKGNLEKLKDILESDM